MNAFIFWPSADRERQSRLFAEQVVPLAGQAGKRRPRLSRVGFVEYRTLGRSGVKISVLTMGTMTFGGTGGFASVGLDRGG